MIESREPNLFRLRFADDLALALALGKHDPTQLRAQAEIVRNGAVGFVNFVTRAWEAYRDSHGLELGEPVPPSEA